MNMRTDESEQIMPNQISISQFNGVDLRVGKVLEASIPEGSEKLIKLKVTFGSEERTIFTGLQSWYEPEFFQDKLFVFVYNLEPRKMRIARPDGSLSVDEESQGMLLAVHAEDDEKPSDSKPLPVEAPAGSAPGQSLT